MTEPAKPPYRDYEASSARTRKRIIVAAIAVGVVLLACVGTLVVRSWLTQTAEEAAVGDCLTATGTEKPAPKPELVEVVDCSDPAAVAKVIAMKRHPMFGIEDMVHTDHPCRAVPGATSAIAVPQETDDNDVVLCLAAA